MVKELKKIFYRIFPEFRGNYHLPWDGRIVSISDPPEESEGTATDEFRPYFAVDIQLLKEDGSDDTDHPVMEALTLPAMMAGDESGQFGFPKVGTRVVICFRYGSPGHPYIQSILPLGLSLPNLEPGEQLWQHSKGIHQRADRDGNWDRTTSGKITDDSMDREISADDNLEEYGQSHKTVDGDDTEEIGGTKTLEALGALILQAATNLQLTSIGDSSQTSLANHAQTIGKELAQIIGTGADIKVILGNYLVDLLAGEFIAGNQIGEIGVDITGLIVCENSITSLKAWLEALIGVIEKIIVTMGTGPNVAMLVQLKTELGFLLK